MRKLKIIQRRISQFSSSFATAQYSMKENIRSSISFNFIDIFFSFEAKLSLHCVSIRHSPSCYPLLFPSSTTPPSNRSQWRDWKKLKNEIFAASEISFIKNFFSLLVKYRKWKFSAISLDSRTRGGTVGRALNQQEFSRRLSFLLFHVLMNTIRRRINNFPF